MYLLLELALLDMRGCALAFECLAVPLPRRAGRAKLVRGSPQRRVVLGELHCLLLQCDDVLVGSSVSGIVMHEVSRDDRYLAVRAVGFPLWTVRLVLAQRPPLHRHVAHVAADVQSVNFALFDAVELGERADRQGLAARRARGVALLGCPREQAAMLKQSAYRTPHVSIRSPQQSTLRAGSTHTEVVFALRRHDSAGHVVADDAQERRQVLVAEQVGGEALKAGGV
jgi:hypothetical protein